MFRINYCLEPPPEAWEQLFIWCAIQCSSYSTNNIITFIAIGVLLTDEDGMQMLKDKIDKGQ